MSISFVDCTQILGTENNDKEKQEEEEGVSEIYGGQLNCKIVQCGSGENCPERGSRSQIVVPCLANVPITPLSTQSYFDPLNLPTDNIAAQNWQTNNF